MVARFLIFSNFEIQLNWYYVRIIFSECFPRSGVDITTVNPPPPIFFSIFEAGDGGGGVTLNIIYGGGALNVDQLLTYCSTPILKHFTLHRIKIKFFQFFQYYFFGGRALNVDKLLTFCSIPMLKHFKLLHTFLPLREVSLKIGGGGGRGVVARFSIFSNFEIPLNWYYVRIIFSECFPRSGVDITTVNPPKNIFRHFFKRGMGVEGSVSSFPNVSQGLDIRYYHRNSLKKIYFFKRFK